MYFCYHKLNGSRGQELALSSCSCGLYVESVSEVMITRVLAFRCPKQPPCIRGRVGWKSCGGEERFPKEASEGRAVSYQARLKVVKLTSKAVGQIGISQHVSPQIRWKL